MPLTAKLATFLLVLEIVATTAAVYLLRAEQLQMKHLRQKAWEAPFDWMAAALQETMPAVWCLCQAVLASCRAGPYPC
ncbi:hypothetical protein PF002_g33463 [Phytophthora fragariae]|uniref:Uncharacterized protein n=2 Tax=Phytophthora TaxID=4783 RepID=A0A6A3UXE1_9STRA|nr:hypothetical protein PF002_g33463 [Phytophthora fragariae]KAE9258579.1 hypothetical protein PF001_g33314 [Phytophthora fragariae]KAE9258714.1 hypothetical protein PR003_g35096 [Phytophthora rubi]